MLPDLILDEECAAGNFAQLVDIPAGHDVCATTGGKAEHHLDRTIRVFGTGGTDHLHRGERDDGGGGNSRGKQLHRRAP